MEDEEAYVRALLASLDGLDAGAELLRTVLSDEAQAAPVSPAKKRPRKPKDEILRLRREVADLEATRDAFQPRSVAASCAKSDTIDSAGVWRRVAQRQLEFLRASREKNQRLRDQVREQLALGRRLARLVLRAKRGLPLDQLPGSLPPVEMGSAYTAMRQELVAMASVMYQSLDQRQFSQMGKEEFQELTVCQRKPSEISLGTRLATTKACRLAPCPLAALSDLLWEHDYSRLPETFRIKHTEQSAYCQVIHYGIDYQTDEGPARYHGIGVRIRVHEETRDVILDTGALWPDATTRSPWNAISYVLKEVAVVQPATTVLVGEGENESFHQVLIHAETLRHVHPLTSSVMKTQEAALLQESVLQSHNFLLEHHNRRIDDLVLGRHIVPCA